MSTGAVQLSSLEISRSIHELWTDKRPRPGDELSAFVSEQCAYFGIDERRCRRIIANAQVAEDALRRGAAISRAQAQAAILGVDHIDVIEKVRDLMDAKKRRAALDAHGNAIKDEAGNPMWEEQPDHRVQLAAAGEMAKILGSRAPKEVHLEATHEHNVNISDDELRRQFASIAPHIGFQILEAEFTVESGGAAAPDSEPAGSASQSR